ncbi:MAG: thioredoxin [Oscillospiraceae bacterium]|nr:thioredoxin [Oscillospiraceae bacterium]
MFYARLAILGIALVLIIGGYIAGGTADVLAKAVAICTECVGLG